MGGAGWGAPMSQSAYRRVCGAATPKGAAQRGYSATGPTPRAMGSAAAAQHSGHVLHFCIEASTLEVQGRAPRLHRGSALGARLSLPYGFPLLRTRLFIHLSFCGI